MLRVSDYPFEAYSDLMKNHHDAAVAMADKLSEIPIFRNRAERMAHCSTVATGLYCPSCKSFHTVRASLCRDRLCPNCGWVLARRRASAVLQALEGVSVVHDPVVLHVVLTLKHSRKDSLSEQLDRLLNGFRKLIRSTPLCDDRIGYIRSVEVKYNKSGFHPHIHMLLIMNEWYYTHMIKQADLVQLWKKACDLDYDPVVWIKQAYNSDRGDRGKNAEKPLHDAIYECVKYCIKTNDWQQMNPGILLEAASAIHGRSLFIVGGKVFRREYFDAEKRIKEACSCDEPEPKCRKCGNEKKLVTLYADRKELKYANI